MKRHRMSRRSFQKHAHSPVLTVLHVAVPVFSLNIDYVIVFRQGFYLCDLI